MKTPPNLRFDAGFNGFTTTMEWLQAIRDAVTKAFPDYEWITVDDAAPILARLYNTDVMVAIHAGANEGHLVKIMSIRKPRTRQEHVEIYALLAIKTLSGIHAAMDMANWLTVALNRLSQDILVAPTDGTGRKPRQALTTRIHDSNAAGNALRHALNEMKAIGTWEEKPTDRQACAQKLRQLANYIESEKCGYIPDMIALLRESATIPIQH